MELEIPERLAKKKLSDLDPEEIQSLMDATASEALDEIKDEDSTLNLAAIGSPYMVGPVDMTLAVGNLVLLNAIDSPLTRGNLGEIGEEIDSVEWIKSLYVLALGRDAVKPVMAIKERIQRLMMIKPMVDKNPALFEMVLDRIEAISMAEADFECAALEWYHDNFAGYDFQEVVNGLVSSFLDLIKISEDLPSDDEKKNGSDL